MIYIMVKYGALLQLAQNAILNNQEIMDKELPTNTFIQPIVDELLEAWNTGFTLYSKKSEKV